MLPKTKRDRVMGAFRRTLDGYVPWDINPCPELLAKWKAHMRTELHPYDYYDLDLRFVGSAPSTIKTDWHALNPDLPPETLFDEYGIPRIPSKDPEGHHFTHTVASALKNAVSVEDVIRYPWPDPDADYRWQETSKQVKDLHEKGYGVVGGAGGFFEGMLWMRGIDETLVELLTESPILVEITKRFNQHSLQRAVRLARAGVDILSFGDDIGNQDRMMISPELWRQWFKQPFADAIRAAKAVNPKGLVFFHSDGYIEPVIPDLIEIGVDILNPVQPECMDPEVIKKEYGSRLSFWGTIGVQTTMPFSTPREIRELVKRRIDIVGKGGGLFLAPAHMLEPEVPLENVMAFIEAAMDYGGHH